MKTISIINLKGGVAKTLTTISMAHILSERHGKRVLVVDNDKQGNTSKTFGVHSYERGSVAELMLDRNADLADIICHTRYQRIDVIPANMKLLTANMQVMMDSSRPQQTRLRAALRKVQDQYDYCLIDNAPDINISTINALVASNEAIIPVKIFPDCAQVMRHLRSSGHFGGNAGDIQIGRTGISICCCNLLALRQQGQHILGVIGAGAYGHGLRVDAAVYIRHFDPQQVLKGVLHPTAFKIILRDLIR